MKKTPITQEPACSEKNASPRSGLRLVRSAEEPVRQETQALARSTPEVARPIAGRALLAFMNAYADAIDRDICLLLDL